ncbi:hypothetical protein ACIQU6_15045, partial [Streptomyces sp. NPDC090442]
MTAEPSRSSTTTEGRTPADPSGTTAGSCTATETRRPAPSHAPTRPDFDRWTHLDALESEAVHIFREVAGEFERPVILFSGGK